MEARLRNPPGPIPGPIPAEHQAEFQGFMRGAVDKVAHRCTVLRARLAELGDGSPAEAAAAAAAAARCGNPACSAAPPAARFMCKRCHSHRYCCQGCQTAHWVQHKPLCSATASCMKDLGVSVK